MLSCGGGVGVAAMSLCTCFKGIVTFGDNTYIYICL